MAQLDRGVEHLAYEGLRLRSISQLVENRIFTKPDKVDEPCEERPAARSPFIKLEMGPMSPRRMASSFGGLALGFSRSPVRKSAEASAQ